MDHQGHRGVNNGSRHVVESLKHRVGHSGQGENHHSGGAREHHGDQHGIVHA